MKINKFFIGGALILAAVAYLIISSTAVSAEYFMTVDELKAKGDAAIGKSVRLSGAVIGDTIQYDPQNLTLSFEIAHVTGDNQEIEAQGGLAEVLHQAVNDPSRQRIQIVYVGPKPDLLRHEAQAIVSGKLGEDSVFYAEEVLLKCPTRYEDSLPQQSEG